MPDMPLTPDELLTTTRSVRKRMDQQLCIPRPVHGPGAGAGNPVHHGAVRLGGRAVTGQLVGIAAARCVELHAGLPGQGPRYRLDHTALAVRDGDRRAARAPRQGALIPTAYYTGDTFRPAARRPLADVLHVDRW